MYTGNQKQTFILKFFKKSLIFFKSWRAHFCHFVSTCHFVSDLPFCQVYVVNWFMV